MTETSRSVAYFKRHIVESLLVPLASLLERDDITNIYVNTFDRIYYDDTSGRHLSDIAFKSENELYTLIKQIARNMNLGFDEDNSIFHARLDDGTRLCATTAPTNENGTSLILRLFPKTRYTLEDLSERGSFAPEVLETLKRIIATGDNFFVAGATNSGKTTMLNAMLACLDNDLEHIVVAQDVPEVRIPSQHVTSLIAPDKVKRSGPDGYSHGNLLETMLRLTPDRIIVGEIRYTDAADALYDALNTGHRGVCTTIHANSVRLAIRRFAKLASYTNPVPFDSLEGDFAQFFDYGIYCHYDKVNDRRYLHHVSYFDEEGIAKDVYRAT